MTEPLRQARAGDDGTSMQVDVSGTLGTSEVAALDVVAITACCEPVFDTPLSEAEAADLAGAFKVLADPARLRLFSLIASSGGEVCACDLVEPLGRSQPTVSHHLSVLHDAGLLEREKRGRWVWYRAVPSRLAVLRDALAA